MKLSEILAGIAQPDAVTGAVEIGGVTADSRAVKPGDLFVAIAGGKADGMRFGADAARAGAVAILAERGEGAPGVPVIVVPNARRALSLAAARLHPRQPATIAATVRRNVPAPKPQVAIPSTFSLASTCRAVSR